MHQIPNKFPVLALLQVLFITPRAMTSQFRARQMSMKELENRISQRGLTQHLDHFDQLLSADAPEPDAKQKGELGTTSAQLLLAGWGPVTSQVDAVSCLPLKNQKFIGSWCKRSEASSRPTGKSHRLCHILWLEYVGTTRSPTPVHTSYSPIPPREVLK